MKISDAALILKKIYLGAQNGKQAVNVHLFGIKYADQIDGMPLKQLAAEAGIPESYGTEIRKGINLAEYVSLKP